MSDTQQRFSAAGLRRITIQLPRGDVTIERIAGQDVVVDAEKPLSTSRRDDELLIGGPAPATKRPRMEMRMGDGMRMRMGDGMEMRIEGELSGIGAQITDVVGTALDAVFGSGTFGSGCDMRIGLPATLELPEIAVTTGEGDLACVDLTAIWSLHTGVGEARLRGCGGRLTLKTGSGDIDVQGFEGSVACTSGSGSIAATAIAGRSELRTGNGEIRVDGCPASGTVLTGAGDVELKGVGGTWNIRSGSGDIEVRVRESASLEIVTGSGDVGIAGGALTALRVQTSSGDVRCESILVGPQHTILSGHGDITLELADPPGARLQVITGHGEVESAFPLVRVGKQGPQSGVRYVGNAGESTIDVELRTSAGDIRIGRRRTDDTYHAWEEAAPAADMPHREVPLSPRPPARPTAPVAPRPPTPPDPPAAPLAPRRPAAPNYHFEGEDSPAHDDLPEGNGGRVLDPLIREARIGTEHDIPAVDPPRSSGVAEPDVAAPTLGAAIDSAQPATGRLAILRSLQRGEINADEAAMLLDAAERAGS